MFMLTILGLVKLKIYTDSQFVINCMTKWYPSWQRNGWYNKQGKPVVNRPQIEELLDAMDGMHISWVSVFNFNF